MLAHSIHTRSSLPVSIAPLMLDQLKRTLTRERHSLQSTDFSFSRFLTPVPLAVLEEAVNDVADER